MDRRDMIEHRKREIESRKLLIDQLKGERPGETHLGTHDITADGTTADSLADAEADLNRLELEFEEWLSELGSA